MNDIEQVLAQFLQDNHVNAFVKLCDGETYVGVDTFVSDEMGLNVYGTSVTVWHFRKGEIIARIDLADPKSLYQILKVFKDNLGCGPNGE